MAELDANKLKDVHNKLKELAKTVSDSSSKIIDFYKQIDEAKKAGREYSHVEKDLTELQTKLRSLNQVELTYRKELTKLIEKEAKERKRILVDSSQEHEAIKQSIQIEKEAIKTVREFSSKLGIAIPEDILNNSTKLSKALNSEIAIEKLKNDLEKNRVKRIRENWHLEGENSNVLVAVGKRLGALSKSVALDAKDFFFQKTGILGKSVSFMGKLFAGKSLGKEGRVSGEEKVEQLQVMSDTLSTNQQMEEHLKELLNLQYDTDDIDAKILDSEEKMGQHLENIDSLLTHENKPVTKEREIIQEDTKSGRMRDETKGQPLGEAKKTNKFLGKLLAKSEGKSTSGLLSLLAGLGMIGGIIGAFLFPEKASIFIGDAVKGALKSATMFNKTVVTVMSLPAKLLERMGSKIGTNLLKPFKAIDRFFSKDLAKFLFKKAVGLTRVLEGFAKIGNPIGKIAGWVGKASGMVAKGFGKAALKKIPVLGLLISLPLAINRFNNGDYIGALLELGSGVASIFPGIGTAISIGIDLISLGRDFFKAGDKKGKPASINKGKPINMNPKNGQVGQSVSVEPYATNQTSNVNTQESEAPIQKYTPTPQPKPTDIVTVVKLHPDSVSAVAKEIQKGFGSELNKNGQFTAKDSASGSLK